MYLYIPKNFVKEFDKELKTLTNVDDLIVIFKKVLNRLRVPYVDACCPPEDDLATVRYNCSKGVLEYLTDSLNNIYIPVPKLNSSIVRYNETTGKLEYLGSETKQWEEVPNG